MNYTAAELRAMLPHASDELVALNCSNSSNSSVRSPVTGKASSRKAKAKRGRGRPHEDLVNRLIDLLHTYGYRVAGFRAARTAQGWRTAVIADGKGFPDLLAFRESDGRRVAIECKIPPDKLGPEQLDWANVLKTCKVEWYMVTPADWEQMSEVLQ